MIAAPIDTDVGQIDRSLEPTDDPRAQTSKIFEYSPEGLLIPEAVSDGATDGEYHSRDIHPSYADVWNDELEVAVPIMIPEANSEAIDDSPTHDYFHPELNATIRIQIPTAIPPPHLRKRAPPPAGPLYGETGGPVMNDIRQSGCRVLSSTSLGRLCRRRQVSYARETELTVSHNPKLRSLVSHRRSASYQFGLVNRHHHV